MGLKLKSQLKLGFNQQQIVEISNRNRWVNHTTIGIATIFPDWRLCAELRRCASLRTWAKSFAGFAAFLALKHPCNHQHINGHFRNLNWRYLPYVRPIFQGYVREYPHKILPYMVHSTSILGSWKFHWTYRTYVGNSVGIISRKVHFGTLRLWDFDING